MRKFISNQSLKLSAAVLVGFMSGAQDALAQEKTFNDVSENMITGIESVPGLITGGSYMIATLLSVLGVLKIKDHVENPSQTPLQQGVVRLAAGGALFALPIITESMLNTLDPDGAAGADTAIVGKVKFGVN